MSCEIGGARARAGQNAAADPAAAPLGAKTAPPPALAIALIGPQWGCPGCLDHFWGWLRVGEVSLLLMGMTRPRRAHSASPAVDSRELWPPPFAPREARAARALVLPNFQTRFRTPFFNKPLPSPSPIHTNKTTTYTAESVIVFCCSTP